MLASVQPFVLLTAWIVLGASVGFVAIHTLFGVARGVRTVWPLAFLFTFAGWMGAGVPGMLVGVGTAALVGLFVAGAK